MTPTVHKVYLGTMAAIVIFITIYLIYTGYSYYSMPLEERFYHPQYDWFKPAGHLGHGLGIIGTFMIVFGVTIYILRKRYNVLRRFIRLKYLLEFHIFLCTLGPILILFHTTFKIGGIVSIAFWSMIAVVISGVIGRFIYIQIPRTIEGRELSLHEIQKMKQDLTQFLGTNEIIDPLTRTLIMNAGTTPAFSLSGIWQKEMTLVKIRSHLKKLEINKKERHHIFNIIKNEISLSGKIARLQRMQKLFRYWHVMHLPFAMIMLIIVLIHVIVTLALGYKWIF